MMWAAMIGHDTVIPLLLEADAQIDVQDISGNTPLMFASIDGEATLKRFYIGSNGIELHPRNDKYSIIYINEEDELVIQGKLVAVIREY